MYKPLPFVWKILHLIRALRTVKKSHFSRIYDEFLSIGITLSKSLKLNTPITIKSILTI
jgi:hypothetical protein